MDTTPPPPSSSGERLVPLSALRKTFQGGYSGADLRADLLAGIAVGLVALPLSMALAIACGVPPQHGLWTAIVAGAVIALLGGSRVQVSGPTAAFVVILAPIVTRYGLGGLGVATALAGVILVLLGLARMGRLIEFIPYPVTAGFTAGIGVVIATLQVRDFLGLEVDLPEGWTGKVVALVRALPTWHPAELGLGVVTLVVLIVWPRWVRRVPGPLVALGLAAVLAVGIERVLPDVKIETIATRFHYDEGGQSHPGIPRQAPTFMAPWNEPGPDGDRALGLDLETIRVLLPSAVAIALLGAIESLLSAVVADGMIRRRHDPNAELLAQGVGNIVAPFFGGFAATGAIARTATNVRAGARSPLAAVFHSVFVLGAMLAFAPLLGYLPMTALAALLLVVAWNIAEVKHVIHAVRVSPRSDGLVLLTCLLLTVVFDMAIAVLVGILLAALLFMRRMAEVTGVRLVSDPHRERPHGLPESVLLYEVSGPLFFGAAQKAMSALGRIEPGARWVLLDLRSVPAIDATGLVNLESTVAGLREQGVEVMLAGLQTQPDAALRKAGWDAMEPGVRLAMTMEEAVAVLQRPEGPRSSG